MKKNILVDFVYNIVATSIPIFVLQLLLLPRIAYYYNGEQYGLMVTLIAMITVCSSRLGNALSNIRLIDRDKILFKNNYNLILGIFGLFSSFVVVAATIYYIGSIDVFQILLNLLLSNLWLWRDYNVVVYRLNINYRGYLYCNIFLVIGYLLGFIIFVDSACWQIIYIMGYIMSSVYITTTSSLWKEGLKIDKKFKKVLKDSTVLSTANFLGNFSTYADRMLIYPIVGGENVTIYYIASLFGKVLSMIFGPISDVILSYVSKKLKRDDDIFIKVILVGGCCGIMGYILCVLLARPLLGVLYPQFVDLAMDYVPVITATMIVLVVVEMINPFIISFFDVKWQVVINIVYIFVYIIVCLSMLLVNGMMGFCFGTMFASVIKLCIELIIYYEVKEKVLN